MQYLVVVHVRCPTRAASRRTLNCIYTCITAWRTARSMDYPALSRASVADVRTGIGFTLRCHSFRLTGGRFVRQLRDSAYGRDWATTTRRGAAQTVSGWQCDHPVFRYDVAHLEMSGTAKVFFPDASEPGIEQQPQQRIATTTSKTAGKKEVAVTKPGLRRPSGRYVQRSFCMRVVLSLCTCGSSRVLPYELAGFQHEADRRLRRLSIEMTSLSVLGVVLMILLNYVCFNYDSLVFMDSSAHCPTGSFMKFVNIGCSIVFMHRLVLYYHCRSFVQMREWRMASRWEAFVESNLIMAFFCEAIIALWQPIPGLESIFGMGHKTVIGMMMLRFYLVVRLLRDFSPVYHNRKQIRSEYEQANPGQKSDVLIGTVLKTYFYSHTISMLVGVFITFVTALAYIEYIVEREFWVSTTSAPSPILATAWVQLSPESRNLYKQSVFALYPNCLWFIAVTSTTVGYGDIYPYDDVGRVVAIVAALTGIVTTSLLVSVLTNRLAPTPFQQFVIDWMNRSVLREKKRQTSARLIQLWWKGVAQKPRLARAPEDETAGKQSTSGIIPVVAGGNVAKPMTSRTHRRRSTGGAKGKPAVVQAMKSQISRFQDVRLEFQSLCSRERQMTANNLNGVTEFQGLTRTILNEQIALKQQFADLRLTMTALMTRLDHIAANQSLRIVDVESST
ncbi:Potassium channel domain-containing protein [Plasmodiophora brassicae]|uniref:Potassium channel domain-containing protein n=1 Tax=Plasmodiophora brassicae TaxID=37360 RepID=A0A3P3YHD2_PLABS|nr:unnamed protein product [Plasmodiophora brassicae]